MAGTGHSYEILNVEDVNKKIQEFIAIHDSNFFSKKDFLKYMTQEKFTIPAPNSDVIQELSKSNQIKFYSKNKKYRKFSAFLFSVLGDDMNNLSDFLKNNPKSYKMSTNDALIACNKWHLSNFSKKTNDMGNVEKIFDCNNFSWFKLKDKKAYEYESSLMKHCVHGYEPEKQDIYSLRYNSKPYVTIEVKNNYVIQIKSFVNRIPEREIIPHVIDFLNHMNFDSSSSTDIKNIMCEKIDGKWCDLRKDAIIYDEDSILSLIIHNNNHSICEIYIDGHNLGTIICTGTINSWKEINIQNCVNFNAHYDKKIKIEKYINFVDDLGCMEKIKNTYFYKKYVKYKNSIWNVGNMKIYIPHKDRKNFVVSSKNFSFSKKTNNPDYYEWRNVFQIELMKDEADPLVSIQEKATIFSASAAQKYIHNNIIPTKIDYDLSFIDRGNFTEKETNDIADFLNMYNVFVASYTSDLEKNNIFINNKNKNDKYYSLFSADKKEKIYSDNKTYTKYVFDDVIYFTSVNNNVFCKIFFEKDKIVKFDILNYNDFYNIAGHIISCLKTPCKKELSYKKIKLSRDVNYYLFYWEQWYFLNDKEFLEFISKRKKTEIKKYYYTVSHTDIHKEIVYPLMIDYHIKEKNYFADYVKMLEYYPKNKNYVNKVVKVLSLFKPKKKYDSYYNEETFTKIFMANLQYLACAKDENGRPNKNVEKLFNFINRKYTQPWKTSIIDKLPCLGDVQNICFKNSLYYILSKMIQYRISESKFLKKEKLKIDEDFFVCFEFLIQNKRSYYLSRKTEYLDKWEEYIYDLPVLSDNNHNNRLNELKHEMSLRSLKEVKESFKYNKLIF